MSGVLKSCLLAGAFLAPLLAHAAGNKETLIDRATLRSLVIPFQLYRN